VKSTPLLFAGLFASFAVAWCAVIAIPQMQIGNLQPQVDEENADVYPVDISGLSEQGRQVYVAQGCGACHTQLIRDAHMGPDIQREWGARRTVARDYIYDTPVTLGSMRNGPDLSNVGAAKSEDSTRRYINDPRWLYLELYSPRSHEADSIMPPYRYLFKKRKISGEPSPEALPLTGANAVRSGYEVVPTAKARALVAFLLSLDKSHPLKEARATAPAAK